MMLHVGMDAGTGYVLTIEVTAANEHDITQTAKLIRENDGAVYVGLGYLSIERREKEKMTLIYP